MVCLPQDLKATRMRSETFTLNNFSSLHKKTAESYMLWQVL